MSQQTLVTLKTENASQLYCPYCDYELDTTNVLEVEIIKQTIYVETCCLKCKEVLQIVFDFNIVE